MNEYDSLKSTVAVLELNERFLFASVSEDTSMALVKAKISE